jgi:hypothetical protein
MDIERRDSRDDAGERDAESRFFERLNITCRVRAYRFPGTATFVR